MSLSLTGPTPGQNSLWPAATRRLAAASLRARVLLIIAVAAVPALVVLGYYLYDLQSLVSPDWQDEIAISFSLVVLGVALVSLGFGVVVGEHTLRQPTEVLLVAAERWTAGELDLRLDVGPAADSEFGRLALAFNGLTESLGRRHAELQALNTELEARVAERTRELSDSNLRLRGEMAERERAEAALRQAQKLQAVGQLAGGIAHDFNNLLTSILGALDLLRGRMGQSQDGSLHLIDSALKAGERGRNLTSQLLGFSGRQRLAPLPTDLNETVAALIELLGSTLDADIRIETDFAQDLWPAMVDPSQAEAAILNLAMNARDAMPEGGTLTFATCNLTLEARNSISAGDYVGIQVSDTGVGMSEEVMSLAFEPFFTTHEPGRGSGLGLSHVHGFAVQSGGDVCIRSAIGHGTTISVLLPRAHAAAASRPLRVASEPPRTRGRTRILVVDDDDSVRQMTADMLVDRGYNATQAAGGEAALALLATDPAFDLLLTDYVMPGMNGLALIQAASELVPGLRSMLMTGRAELAAGLPLEPDRVLAKPFTLAMLDDHVCRALGRPRLQVIKGGMSEAG